MIAITGMGAVSALGIGTRAMERALFEGRDGIAPIERFVAEGVPEKNAGMVLWPGDASLDTRALCAAFASRAALEALDVAGASSLHVAPGRARAAIVLGTSFGDNGASPHTIAAIVAGATGVAGPRVTISTACASSTNAIGLAADLIRAGEADLVLAGGADVLTKEILAGFSALGLLAKGKCAPFGDPPGTTLGEGAGFVVMERADVARSRGAAAIALFLGYGLSADAHHATTPDPSGAGMARAMRGAIDDAAIDASIVDYVNAHGTGTIANDASEARAIATALGDRSRAVPVSATKSYLGHAQGAAGVLELIATILCMRRGAIPPTLRVIKPRPHTPADPVAEAMPRAHAVRVALSNSAAFGGANAVVAVADPSFDRAPKPERSPRRVRVIGAGAVGPFGVTMRDLDRATHDQRVLVGRAASFKLRDRIPTADARGLDPSACAMTWAAAEAIASSGVALKGSLRDRAGIFAAVTRASPSSAVELDRSIRDHGLAGLSAAAFTRVVLNAPAGACSRLLSLRGPTTTLSAGTGGGLAAILYAARWIARRDDADLIVAGGADEIDEAKGDVMSEAAGFVLLSASPRRSGLGVIVAGASMCGPGMLAEARARALREAGAMGEGARPLAIDPRSILVRADASGSALAVAFAAQAIGDGSMDRVIVEEMGEGMSCAVVLVREEDRDGR